MRLIMSIYTSTQARAKFSSLIEETNETHEPIYVKGKRHNAVIISKEDYEGLLETLHIYSVPGLVDEILEASNSPPEDFISHEEFWK
jgi:antitoxin YefM